MVESSAVGTAAMASVIRHPRDGRPSGVFSLASPSARLGEARMHQCWPFQLRAIALQRGMAARRV
ncbi:hypothetical protein D3C78_1543230 [compost metagenome]